MNSNRFLVALATVGFAAALPSMVNAGELVTNGGFEINTGGGQLGFNQSATGWTVPAAPNSYAFLFPTVSDALLGVGGEYGNVPLWGIGNGGLDALTASPTGGAFIGMDGAFQVGPISQTINGLTAGQTYVLNFDWAAGQQFGFNGDTTDQWIVGFGSQTQSTSVASVPSHGFSGWMHATMDFTADGASDLLMFTPNGTPAGVPPFALLDSVSMQAVPEKSSAAAMILGVGGFGIFARRRARSKSSK